MQVSENLHLTYCSNIHSGETWEEVFVTLQKNIPEIKNSISPGKRFGIGLRLSAEAAKTLLTENHLPEFKEWLDKNECYVFTMNGFPYGNFHGAVVKDEVYKPDWTYAERLNYTLNLVEILAKLIPENSEAGISTSPVSYKPWLASFGAMSLSLEVKVACENLLKCVEKLFLLRKETGKYIHIDIEPEPDCLLENSDETIAFYKEQLIPYGISYFGEKHSLSAAETESIIKNHINICYDVCHFAVEYENPFEAIAKFQKEGIRIGKIQISSALKILTGKNADRKKILEQYSKFAESTYLHQTIVKDAEGKLHHFPDLPEALKNFDNPDFVEWRTHYHVPVFMPSYSELQSTQEDIFSVLDILKNKKFTNHLEVETYTWEVLPQEERLSMNDSILRELNWVLNQLK
jgi:hypothetical protein